MMGITGLALSFLGSLILAINAITGNASVFIIDSHCANMTHEPKLVPI